MSVETVGEIRIHTERIPEWDERALAQSLYDSVLRFFSVPENQAKYEAWLAERERKAASDAAR